MVAINIPGNNNSGTVPQHLCAKKSSKKPKEMKTAMFIIFGLLIGIILFLGYWKMSSELDSIKHKLIKIQINLMPAITKTFITTTTTGTTTTGTTTTGTMTTATTTTATMTTDTTTTSTTTTFENEEFWLKVCEHDYDENTNVLTYLKCEKIRKQETDRKSLLYLLMSIGVLIAAAICCNIFGYIYRCLKKWIKDRNTEVVVNRIPDYPNMRPEPVPIPNYFWPNRNRL